MVAASSAPDARRITGVTVTPSAGEGNRNASAYASASMSSAVAGLPTTMTSTLASACDEVRSPVCVALLDVDRCRRPLFVMLAGRIATTASLLVPPVRSRLAWWLPVVYKRYLGSHLTGTTVQTVCRHL